MIDKILIWKFRCGSKKALCDIYTKYEDIMLTVAVSLLHDVSLAEDVVHDVFVNFAQSASKINPDGNLKGYLIKCVANLARDRIRAKYRQVNLGLEEVKLVTVESSEPLQRLIKDEKFRILNHAMAQLPYEQNEIIILRLQGGMTFREIASLLNISINTVNSRYRYGLEKLRSLLNSEVEKWDR